MAAGNDTRGLFAAEGATITLPSDREIRIVRTFKAPRQTVFETWVRPEHVRHWWDPAGTTLAACEIDLRPGGTFRFVNSRPNGAGHAFTGIYREIAPPARLVFSIPAPGGGESTAALAFEEHQGRTILTLIMTAPSKEARDLMLKMRIDAGTAQTLENLSKYFERTFGS